MNNGGKHLRTFKKRIISVKYCSKMVPRQGMYGDNPDREVEWNEYFIEGSKKTFYSLKEAMNWIENRMKSK